MTPPVLAAEAVTVRIGDAILLDRVSVDVESGQKLAVVGPNGAGKTSLLRCLTGSWTPSEGVVVWDGRPMSTVSARTLAQSRAVVSQASALDFDFSVQQVVEMGLSPHGRVDPYVVFEALREVGGQHLSDRRWTRLSGGEQQRVRFARALCQLRGARRPGRRALLLDEPTNHLDPAWQLQALDVAAGCARQGVAVLAILHDLSLASAWADRVVVLHEGRKVADGEPADVLTRALLADVFRLTAAVVPHPQHARPWILPAVSLLDTPPPVSTETAP